MKNFSLYKSRNDNYTPSSLLTEYAKAHKILRFRNCYGQLGLCIDGNIYFYDSWSIAPLNSITDRVTVYLVQAGERKATS